MDSDRALVWLLLVGLFFCAIAVVASVASTLLS